MTETRFPRVLNVFLSFKFCLGQWGVQWVGMPLLCNRWPSIRFHPAIHLSFRKWQLKGREIKQRKILLDTILQHQPLWKHRVMGTNQGVNLIKAKQIPRRPKWPKHPESRWPRMTQMRLKWLRMAYMTQSGPRWHRKLKSINLETSFLSRWDVLYGLITFVFNSHHCFTLPVVFLIYSNRIS